ncbi:MAG: sugar transferase [bacterium]|nr:sugar transferase [bacterium]
MRIKGLRSKNNRRIAGSALIDILFINLAILGGYLLYPWKDLSLTMVLIGPFWSFYRIFAPIITCVRLFFLFFFGFYEQKEPSAPAYESLEKVFKATTLSSIIIFTFVHILRSYHSVNINLSRYICFLEWGLNILFLLGWRFISFHLIPWLLRKKPVGENTLIIGESSKDGLHYLENLNKIPYQRWEIVGYLAATAKKSAASDDQNSSSLRYLDNISNFLEVVNRYEIKNVILVSHEFPSNLIDGLIEQCNALGIRFFILPGLYELFAGKVKLQPLGSVPLFELILEPINGFNRVAKRAFDIIFSLVAIIIFFPLMVIIALAVKLSSKGPIFFKQIRIGKDNRPFVIYKFRSMIDNAEECSGPIWAEENDPRITPVGRILRKTSLDELPQLFLVLWGKLSIVGPRPERPHFVNQYKEFQGLRLRIKPGLTGLAQINGRYEASLDDKLQHDIFYINNYSFYLDLVIIIKTIWAVITAQGAR